jgi:hypothetical protein
MQASHTPAPWTRIAHTNGRLGETICFLGSDEFTATDICTVMPEDEHGEAQHVAEANARLIAAAPELLRACEAAIVAICGQQQWLAVQHPHVWGRLMDATNTLGEAIEKAVP